MSAPASSGRIMVELLFMPYFYMWGNGGRGEGRGDIELVVYFNLSEAVSAPASSGRIMVEHGEACPHTQLLTRARNNGFGNCVEPLHLPPASVVCTRHLLKYAEIQSCEIKRFFQEP